MNEVKPVLKCCLLTNRAFPPTRATEQAAGADLYTPFDYELPPLSTTRIETEVAVQFDPGHYARIAPRSGLAARHHIHIGGGVIDSDYRGPLTVIVTNLSPHFPYRVRRGDRIAQLIIEKIQIPKIEIVQVSELNKTMRGNKGLGSTGR